MQGPPPKPPGYGAPSHIPPPPYQPPAAASAGYAGPPGQAYSAAASAQGPWAGGTGGGGGGNKWPVRWGGGARVVRDTEACDGAESGGF